MPLYVVTGGAGFIGSRLAAALLLNGEQVLIVDDFSVGRRRNVPAGADVLAADAAQAEVMRFALRGAAGCFHLAGNGLVSMCNENWAATHRANQGTTVAVLDGARACGLLPVVYASCAAVYGDHGQEPLAESARPRPLSAYAADKLGSEMQARAGFLVHGVPSIGFRIFNVYGPGQEDRAGRSGVVATFADCIQTNRAVTLDGDGTQTRDFVFVNDVVQHLIAGMRSLHAAPRAEVLNICTGRPTRIHDLALAIGDLLGRRPRFVRSPLRAGAVQHSLGDPARTESVLGISARTMLREGLRATFREPEPIHRAA